MSSRRDFIKKTASASLFASLASTQSLFANKLDKIVADGNSDIADQYMLDPNIAYVFTMFFVKSSMSVKNDIRYFSRYF